MFFRLLMQTVMNYLMVMDVSHHLHLVVINVYVIETLLSIGNHLLLSELSYFEFISNKLKFS